jgi:hypothetical protein
MVYEERLEAEYARALEKSRRTGKPMEIDPRGRAIMPRWPLLTGILPFLLSRGVPVRWFALSVGFIGALSILLYGLEMAMSGGMGAIAGMCFFAIGCIATMLCAAVAASALLAIVTESSEGNREVQYWPGIHDWFGDMLILGVAGMVSAIPGWLIARFVAADDVQIGLCIGGGMLICLPIGSCSVGHQFAVGVVSGRCSAAWRNVRFRVAVLPGNRPAGRGLRGVHSRRRTEPERGVAGPDVFLGPAAVRAAAGATRLAPGGSHARPRIIKPRPSVAVLGDHKKYRTAF